MIRFLTLLGLSAPLPEPSLEEEAERLSFAAAAGQALLHSLVEDGLGVDVTLPWTQDTGGADELAPTS